MPSNFDAEKKPFAAAGEELIARGILGWYESVCSGSSILVMLAAILLPLIILKTCVVFFFTHLFTFVAFLPATFLYFVFYEFMLMFYSDETKKNFVIPSVFTWSGKTFFIVFSITHVIVTSWFILANNI